MVQSFVFAFNMKRKAKPAALRLIAQEAQLGQRPFFGLLKRFSIKAQKAPHLIKTEDDFVFGSG